jgi:hypothetical protein
MLLASALLVGWLLAGCSMTRRVGIEAGEYELVCGEGAANSVAMQAIQGMEIDRGQRLVAFVLADGSEIITPFVPRDRAGWPEGCPTNVHSTQMEVLDLEAKALSFESLVLNRPILVRACPPNPEHVVLREDGEIGGGGAACANESQCIFFGPARDRPWSASDRVLSTGEGEAVPINVVPGDGSLDPGTVAFTRQPAHGTVVNDYDGTVTYTPASGFHGTDAFTYRICDFHGAWDMATVAVTVGAGDDG